MMLIFYVPIFFATIWLLLRRTLVRSDHLSAFATFTTEINHPFNSEKPTPSFIIQLLSTSPLRGGEVY